MHLYLLSIREYGLSEYVKIETTQAPVLMSEKPFNSSKKRQKMSEIMFEKYESPALFLSKDSVLSSYACGKTTGLVVDIGAGGTVIAPGRILLLSCFHTSQFLS